MQSIRAYKFRLYPTKRQEERLKEHLWAAKELWNALLEKEKESYEMGGKFLLKMELQRLCKGTRLYAQVAQAIAHRLHKAIMAKIKAKKDGIKWGFPRFKSTERMRSLYYPQFGFRLQGNKLKVSPFGEMAIKRHREIAGRIKTLTIKRMPSGKWFAIFVVMGSCKEFIRNKKGAAVGIDLGLTKFATLSDGTSVENPHHLKKCEERLAPLQRKLSRKRKGGGNRDKARIMVARLHEKVANMRGDFLHKTANSFISRYSLIGLERLASRKMAMKAHGKGINDAAWNKFASILCYKAEEAGCKVVLVNPGNTSKECSNCGQLVEKHLWERVHSCPRCGLSMDRDLNAAINILKRATAGTAGSNACGDGTIVPSGKQEASPSGLRQSTRANTIL